MQMIALKPKEIYKLCADDRLDGVDLECCDPIWELPNILFSYGVLRGHAGGL
jgi:hypothetical protein